MSLGEGDGHIGMCGVEVRCQRPRQRQQANAAVAAGLRFQRRARVMIAGTRSNIQKATTMPIT
ncbi:MAG: hypothetical protein RMJ55_02010, partial [Roseiflexaceae bacterium]|nr:hypothetical protein [Roseiflexaceae bacterium]